MSSRVALTGKTIRGRIPFAAAQQGELLLRGGSWKRGEYSALVLPRMRQLVTIDIAAVLDNTAYTITIDGVPYTITSDGTAVNTEIRDALIAQIALRSPANGVEGVIVDADTLNVRALRPNELHTVSVGANLTLVANAFDTPPTYNTYNEDGRVVVRTTAAFTGEFEVLVQG